MKLGLHHGLDIKHAVVGQGTNLHTKHALQNGLLVFVEGPRADGLHLLVLPLRHEAAQDLVKMPSLLVHVEGVVPLRLHVVRSVCPQISLVMVAYHGRDLGVPGGSSGGAELQ